MNFAPAGFYSSESEDEDGFMYSGDYDDFGERIRQPRRRPEISREDEMYNELNRCALSGDVVEFRKRWEENLDRLNVNASLGAHNWTPLMFACQGRHVELVKYLLFELDADPNCDLNDWNALILTCSGSIDVYSNEATTSDESNALQICQWLLQRNAMVDKANLRRETALIHASSNGFTSVIELLLENKAALEACDVDRKTALFYAVNGNRIDAVRVLIEAGANVDAEDRYGETPKILAQSSGTDELLALFPPDPVVEFVPSEFTNYNSYTDFIPTAFPERERPAYSPDVFSMLDGMRVLGVRYKFYEARISLPQLLTISDELLRGIGINFPYHRQRVLLSLLKFHEKKWSKDSISVPQMNANIQDYFSMLSNCLRMLIVTESSLKFIKHHSFFSNAQNEECDRIQIEINRELSTLRGKVMQILRLFQKNKDLAPPPPLFVCKNVIRDALNQKKTFRAQLIRRIKIFSCIGAAVLAVMSVRAR